MTMTALLTPSAVATTRTARCSAAPIPTSTKEFHEETIKADNAEDKCYEKLFESEEAYTKCYAKEVRGYYDYIQNLYDYSSEYRCVDISAIIGPTTTSSSSSSSSDTSGETSAPSISGEPSGEPSGDVPVPSISGEPSGEDPVPSISGDTSGEASVASSVKVSVVAMTAALLLALLFF